MNLKLESKNRICHCSWGKCWWEVTRLLDKKTWHTYHQYHVIWNYSLADSSGFESIIIRKFPGVHFSDKLHQCFFHEWTAGNWCQSDVAQIEWIMMEKFRKSLPGVQCSLNQDVYSMQHGWGNWSPFKQEFEDFFSFVGRRVTIKTTSVRWFIHFIRLTSFPVPVLLFTGMLNSLFSFIYWIMDNRIHPYLLLLETLKL